MKRRVALYPGSFDCLTYGHLDLIERGRVLFDDLIVAVAANSRKTPLFTEDERLALLRATTRRWKNVTPTKLDGLTVDFARRVGAQFIVRGLRAVSDYEFELQLAIMNHQLNPDVETIFLAPNPKHIFLSSSVVKDVWRHGGDVSPYVPPPVFKALKKKRTTE